ncbi:helix-hairpin-helix domain-containing protein [Fibrella forsythiae]|uniref:DNA polymerase/3'-5' exonuclease PolX n=1 Tax=Fibrella forsythiae TaxID=2817061 RepID=A0ABS3JPB2_9BACT|nr:helix-hairpin-helix domain-containing protein [Fibrella forsythiae]MBO0950762.1 DNA polymerase/3'-5' exonuclease PolX [Fibrella forsythiae]
MTNSDIIDSLELTARLMELHNGDPFRTKAFSGAAFSLEKVTEDLTGQSVADLIKLPGIGKTVATKIREFVETGHLAELDELLAQTPPGVLDMFRIKGLGVKKVKTLWHELGIETLRDLRQASETGRVAAIKGFGEKIQQNILDNLDFLESQSGKVRMDKADRLAIQLRDELAELGRVEVSGQVRRRSIEVDTVELLVESDDPLAVQMYLNAKPGLTQDVPASSPFTWRGRAEGTDVRVAIITYPAAQFDQQLFIRSASGVHLAETGPTGKTLLQSATNASAGSTEETIYAQAGLPFVVPEMRENEQAFRWSQRHQPDELITWDDLRGTLHNHSTWSDGKHTLRQMADYARELGLQYFGIADHSQTASYAGGLTPERVAAQQLEIDAINADYKAAGLEFRILKGIESDILGDGSLDYTDEVLATFDYVVASVHQTLNMTQEKATARLLRAIENPYTTILGHPTGRLLLAREGYPLDFRAIIDACAANRVVIEINASPYRLDLDWRWIDYAMNRGVLLSINPDAHEMRGLHDMQYGVYAARKGGLTRSMTFNAFTLDQMNQYVAK